MPLSLPSEIIDEYQFDDWTHADERQPPKPTKAKDVNPVVREGVLSKRNEWYWKQERLFVLQWDGQMKYFDMDINQKGTI